MAKKYPPIPPHIKVSTKKSYEVLHIEDFKDGLTYGECRFDPPQIVLKKGLAPKEEFSTFIHELLHMASFEADAGLTETQVLKLEKVILKMLVANKWI